MWQFFSAGGVNEAWFACVDFLLLDQMVGLGEEEE